MKILAISGSLRVASTNTALLRAASELAPAGVAVEIHDLRGIPLFDQDLEEAGCPATVLQLAKAAAAADAFLFACPEYNGGVTGALKNAIDWLSRPDHRAVLLKQPAGILGTTPGGGGTRLAQLSLRQTLGTLGLPVLPTPAFALASAGSAFENGELVDASAREPLGRFMAALHDWAERLR